MNNLPKSLINIASKYANLDDASKTKFLNHALQKQLSIKAIAELCNTYPNKIRRDALSLGLSVPNKSQAQHLAIKSGRHKHPTKGIKRKEEVKVKISNGMAKAWKGFDDKELTRRAEISRQQWAEKSPEEQKQLREKAGQKIREAAVHGSKLEHYLMHELIKAGYKVDFHREYLLPNERLQVDLYLPILKVALEVDGPSHFSPIWGEETLARNKASDATKNGLLLGMNLCVIRIKQKKYLSKKFKRDILAQLLELLKNISKKFPDKNNRYIELGD